MKAARPVVALAVAMALMATAGTGCSGRGGTPSASAADGPGATVRPPPPAGPLVTGSDGDPAPIRAGDETDVEVLAAEMIDGAGGDPEWATVFGRLRSMSWLASRYPGRYELTDIYDEYHVAYVAADTEAEYVTNGVYIDEPLPRLVSIAEAGQLGSLTHLVVVLDTGEATIRDEATDQAVGTLPGGIVRGRFTVGPSGSGGAWRIHGVAALADDPETGVTAPDRDGQDVDSGSGVDENGSEVPAE